MTVEHWRAVTENECFKTPSEILINMYRSELMHFGLCICIYIMRNQYCTCSLIETENYAHKSQLNWVLSGWLWQRQWRMCVETQEEGTKHSLSSCRSSVFLCRLSEIDSMADMYRSDGCPPNKQNKMSQMWRKLSCFHISFPLPLRVFLSFCLFKNPHALGLLLSPLTKFLKNK